MSLRNFKFVMIPTLYPQDKKPGFMSAGSSRSGSPDKSSAPGSPGKSPKGKKKGKKGGKKGKDKSKSRSPKRTPVPDPEPEPQGGFRVLLCHTQSQSIRWVLHTQLCSANF